jgi:hypothetical protein
MKQGVLRHRFVELCLIVALATLFFTYFHILEVPAPNFEPKCTDPVYGKYGRQDLYKLFVLSTNTPNVPMAYGSKCAASVASPRFLLAH